MHFLNGKWLGFDEPGSHQSTQSESLETQIKYLIPVWSVLLLFLSTCGVYYYHKNSGNDRLNEKSTTKKNQWWLEPIHPIPTTESLSPIQSAQLARPRHKISSNDKTAVESDKSQSVKKEDTYEWIGKPHFQIEKSLVDQINLAHEAKMRNHLNVIDSLVNKNVKN